MRTPHPPGMDHPHYRFSPLPQRPKLAWPGDKPLALTVFLYFEHWHTIPAPDAVIDKRFLDPFGRFDPDYRAFSIRQYGHRVGVFRVLDALDATSCKVTVAANAEAIAHYPYLVEQFLKRGYEFAAHGLNASQMASSQMTEADEIAFIGRSASAVERATGCKPAGWIAQDYGELARTPALLAEAGFAYVADWANDDQPYRMTTTRPLVSVPNQADLDDVQLLWHRRVETSRYAEIVQAGLAQLAQEGSRSARFAGLHIHPWLLGMPHRIRYLELTLRFLMESRDVWFATAAEVAAAAAPQLQS